jgi:hypothetical protein
MRGAIPLRVFAVVCPPRITWRTRRIRHGRSAERTLFPRTGCTLFVAGVHP